MNRMLLLTLVVGLSSLGLARADIPPPPGLKRVPVEHTITTEKEYPEWDFYTLMFNSQPSAVKLGPKTPLHLKGTTNPRASYTLVAVPKDAAKAYPSEKDFHKALADGSVKGLAKCDIYFNTIITIKTSDKRTVVRNEYVIEKVSAKDGIAVKAAKSNEKGRDEASEPAEDGSPLASSISDLESDRTTDVETNPVASTPRGGMLAAGICASVGVAFAGFWLARRRSTRPA